MRKRGPCFHCGIDTLLNRHNQNPGPAPTKTPLWRNGPPEKPILCNACGSRYRLRGTLANYTPKHFQALLPSRHNNKHKRTKATGLKTIPPKFQHGSLKPENNFKNSFCAVADTSSSHDGADISNKSTSTESTTSLSSYPDNKKSHGSQLPGQIHQSFWDFHVPTRKRSLVTYRTLTPIEQLQTDLYNILIYDEPSILHKSEEDVLLYITNNQIAPTEIGLGSILLKK